MIALSDIHKSYHILIFSFGDTMKKQLLFKFRIDADTL